MKPILYNFDASQTGVVTLMNSQQTGDTVTTDQVTSAQLDIHHTATHTTVQTIFAGSPATYNIQCNLGMVDSVYGSPTQGQTIVNPNGWVNLPTAILAPGSSAAVLFGFTIPFFALRINTSVAGTGVGSLVILQQGIRS